MKDHQGSEKMNIHGVKACSQGLHVFRSSLFWEPDCAGPFCAGRCICVCFPCAGAMTYQVCVCCPCAGAMTYRFVHVIFVKGTLPFTFLEGARITSFQSIVWVFLVQVPWVIDLYQHDLKSEWFRNGICYFQNLFAVAGQNKPERKTFSSCVSHSIFLFLENQVKIPRSQRRSEKKKKTCCVFAFVLAF